MKLDNEIIDKIKSGEIKYVVCTEKNFNPTVVDRLLILPDKDELYRELFTLKEFSIEIVTFENFSFYQIWNENWDLVLPNNPRMDTIVPVLYEGTATIMKDKVALKLMMKYML